MIWSLWFQLCQLVHAFLGRIHAFAVKKGLNGDLGFGNTLIVTYLKSGVVEIFRKIFDRINEKDMISWNSIIEKDMISFFDG